MAAVQRLVNLALFLAASRCPVTADRIRNEDIGYPEGQEETAFLRMFERDKDDLRGMGFVIHVDDEGAYRLDTRATLAAAIDLTPSEAAVVRVVGAALLDDASFPFSDDLRLALAKVTAETPGDRIVATARLADEDPLHQGEAVAVLSAAASSRKRVVFDYTNSQGTSAEHVIEPYGLFLHDGRWYVVGRDTGKGEVRTYTVARMRELSPNAVRPKDADFEKPADFDVTRFVRLPFQYGDPDKEFAVRVTIEEPAAWRTEALTAGQGTVAPAQDGSLTWTVQVRSETRFVRWVLENGPGLTVIEPPRLVDTLRDALSSVVALHG